jgi:hypothetical protein
MKTGWYKVDYRGHDMVGELPLHGGVVFLENGVITSMSDEWGGHKKEVNLIVTEEMKKHMTIMDFLGVA